MAVFLLSNDLGLPQWQRSFDFSGGFSVMI